MSLSPNLYVPPSIVYLVTYSSLNSIWVSVPFSPNLTKNQLVPFPVFPILVGLPPPTQFKLEI